MRSRLLPGEIGGKDEGRNCAAIRTAEEVGDILHITKQAVLRIERRALWKIYYRMRDFWREY
jgi:DNA-directed RNA polymerase sigma subunit (sigma70/sigma32)